MKSSAPVSTFEIARRALRMRQQDVADVAGLSRALVGMVERGYRPGPENCARLAEAVGRRIEELWP
jgi:transcriptional regulator with XRE-family HTH domain